MDFALGVNGFCSMFKFMTTFEPAVLLHGFDKTLAQADGCAVSDEVRFQGFFG